MGLFRKTGPPEFDAHTPFDAFAAAASNLYGASLYSEGFREWLSGDAPGLAENYLVGSTTQSQLDSLNLGVGKLYMELRQVVLSKAKNRQILEEDFARKVTELVSLTITRKLYRDDPLPFEWPIALVTANGAARMGELRRYKQCQEIIREGVIQLGALIAYGESQTS